MAPTRASGPDSSGHCFKQALRSSDFSVIAEIKRRSPSAGDLCPGVDIGVLARQYRQGGAAGLSVLTNGPHFGGSPGDLQQARQAASLPVLRKDFLTSFEDIHATQAMGADALLLIVADVRPTILRPLHELAFSLGLDVLTEIRNLPELEIAMGAGADIIVVNQRTNPRAARFTVDYGQAVALAPRLADLDAGIIKVAASGIGVVGGTRITDLVAAGYDVALIGEALVTASGPAAKLESLLLEATQVD